MKFKRKKNAVAKDKDIDIKKTVALNSETEIQKEDDYRDVEDIIKQATFYEDNNDIGMKTMRLEIPDYTLELGLASDIGRREYQQDVAMASYENKDGDTKAIAILCDGMGGMNNGEIASNVCMNQIFDDYRAKGNIDDFNAFLIDEACKADEYVSSLTDKEGEPLNSGCTLIAVIIENKKLFWVSVGDSRIYVIRNDEIVQVTTDHNYMMLLKEKVEDGFITLEEALSDKNKDALISYIGMCGLKFIDSNAKPFEIVSDDFILMCSDGLYRTLSCEQIKNIISQNYNNVSLAVQELVDTAVCNGPSTQDNTSAILIKCI